MKHEKLIATAFEILHRLSSGVDGGVWGTVAGKLLFPAIFSSWSRFSPSLTVLNSLHLQDLSSSIFFRRTVLPQAQSLSFLPNQTKPGWVDSRAIAIDQVIHWYFQNIVLKKPKMLIGHKFSWSVKPISGYVLRSSLPLSWVKVQNRTEGRQKMLHPTRMPSSYIRVTSKFARWHRKCALCHILTIAWVIQVHVVCFLPCHHGATSLSIKATTKGKH